MTERSTRERVERVEDALEALEGLPSTPREAALDAVGALVELYGEGLARMLARTEELAPGSVSALADDELIAHLLMIHDLHPDGVEKRVRGALAEVGTAVNADGARVELLAVEAGVARLRLGPGSGEGFADLVRKAVLGAAPELERVEVERPPPAGARRAEPALVQLRVGRAGKDASLGEGEGS